MLLPQSRDTCMENMVQQMPFIFDTVQLLRCHWSDIWDECQACLRSLMIFFGIFWVCYGHRLLSPSSTFCIWRCVQLITNGSLFSYSNPLLEMCCTTHIALVPHRAICFSSNTCSRDISYGEGGGCF